MTKRSQDYWALEDVTRCCREKLRGGHMGFKKCSTICIPLSRSLRGKPAKGNRRLEKLYSCSERGLPVYGEISISELRKFVAARGLEPKVSHARKSKKHLKELLKEADEKAVFPRFEVCLILTRSHILRVLTIDRNCLPSCGY